jgi:hypothetical protein
MNQFEEHLKGKYPELDIKVLVDIFDKNIAEVQASRGLEEIRLPLGCDLNKAIFAAVLSEYLKQK